MDLDQRLDPAWREIHVTFQGEASPAASAQRGHMRLILLTALCATLAVVAAQASAHASLVGGNCGTATPVFSPWGDSNSYYRPANGGFESGTAGWSLSSGAQVVTGNEPWNLGGAGSHSLQLNTGSIASTSVCYGLFYPAIRFVDRGVGGNATLHVRIVAHSLLGVLSVLDGGTFTVGPNWSPSPKVSTLLSALSAPLGTKTMEIQISVTAGTAQVDDLYIDPYCSR